MDRYVSDQIELPFTEGGAPFTRADLIFDGVDHSGASFEARVFFDNPDADEGTPTEAKHGYAGRFVVFGHGGCAGEEGHCDVPADQNASDDLRLPHPLTPATKPVVVTEAFKRLTEARVTITVVPVLPGADGPRRADVLFFESVELTTYV